MIDVSQWRASIGLWNYCQAASSRPANGRHSHSFKAAVDSGKSGSTTSGEKTSKLPAALSLIAFLLLLFLSLSLLRHILMITPTGKQQLQLCTCIFTGTLLLGNCYQVQCTTGVTVTDTNYLQSVVLPGGSSFNLIYNDLYLIVCLRMLLLLSGDVEPNPGPMIDDQPDISLLIQWLEPLVNWKQFGLGLPGITYSNISKIEAQNVKIEDRKLVLYSKWLSVNPKATWRDVIDALTSIKQNKLAEDIRFTLVTGTMHQYTAGNPKDILRTHSSKLTDAITTNLYRVTDALYAEGLIPLNTKETIQTVTGISDYRKSSQLVSVIQRQLESTINLEQYLIDICHVLINQQHLTLTDIATSILHQLGECVCVCTLSVINIVIISQYIRSVYT